MFVEETETITNNMVRTKSLKEYKRLKAKGIKVELVTKACINN